MSNDKELVISMIKKKLGNLVNETAKFECCSDNIMCYSYENKPDLLFYEFEITSDEEFFNEEKIIDLLEKSRIQFLQLHIYFVNPIRISEEGEFTFVPDEVNPELN